MAKTPVNFRLDDRQLAILDRVSKAHRVENRTAVLEWMIAEADRKVQVLEMARDYWPKKIVEEHGEGAAVSVRITGPHEDEHGQRIYRAEASVDNEPSELVEAGIVERPAGVFEVLLFHPKEDGFPTLVFDVISEAQLIEAAEVSGWEGSADLCLSIARRASEMATLPISRLPGPNEPETRAEVIT